MTRRLILFGLWCTVLGVGTTMAVHNAYSFYSDDEDRPAASGHPGPSHK